MLNRAAAAQDDQWLQCLPEILDFDLVYFDDLNTSASLLPVSHNCHKNSAAFAKADK